MQDLPLMVSIGFGITTLIAVYIFYLACNRSSRFILVILSWILVQSVLSLNKFYLVFSGTPPRILLLIAPPLLTIALLFIFPAGRRWLDTLNVRTLTSLHILRIPVELCMLVWYLYGWVPRIMTLEGFNPDILIGISAAIIYFLLYNRKPVSSKAILFFNIVGLLFLMNIVCIAFLSAPLPFQRLGFEQPNNAIFYFPFVWLPSVIVPLVLMAHLTGLLRLLKFKGIVNKNSYPKHKPLLSDYFHMSERTN